MVRNDKV